MVLASFLPPFILEWCCFVHHHAAPCVPPHVTCGAPDPDSGAPLSWDLGSRALACSRGPAVCLARAGCCPC